jgi:tetratricopeptide (TPR) repeat protein
MRRPVLIAAGVAATVIAAVFLYLALSREADYRARVAEGDRALAADQTFPAIEAFTGAIVLKPDAMLGYLRRGEAYRRQGEPSSLSALRDLRKAAELDPTALKPLEGIGDINFSLDRYAKAAESYEAYIKLDERSPRVLYKLALSHFRLGNRSDARAQTELAVIRLKEALAYDDRSAEALYLLGVCEGQLGRTAEAVEVLERVVSMSGTLLPARQELVRLLLALKRDQEAIDQLDALAALDQANVDHLIQAGLVYARMGRTDLAVTELGKAAQRAERSPAQPRVYEALGRVWLEAAEVRRDTDRIALNKAFEALDRCVRDPRASSEGLTLYGRALLLNGDPAGAQQVFDQATQKPPVDPDAYRQIGLLALRRGDLVLARDSMVRCLALTTEPRHLRDLPGQVGELCLRLDEPGEAVKWLKQAAGASNDDAESISRLVTAQVRAGDHQGAAASVEQGLKKSPTSKTLLALRRQIGVGTD